LRDTVNLPDRSGGKEIIFDVYCTDKHNNHYIVEMQTVNQYNFFERAQYYAARALGNQLKASNDYIDLLPVVFVGVVNYSLDKIKMHKRSQEFRNNSVIRLDTVLKSSDEVISKYSFVNQQTNQIIPVPLIELNFVELPLFTKSIEECTTDVDQWLYLMKNANECNEIPQEMQKTKFIVEAFKALEERNFTPEELRKYVEEQEAIGMEDRIREGLLEYALDEAHKKGAQKNAEATAINFLKMGISLEIIAQGTGLSIEQIKTLKEKL
jgi:predicted transposase/invertase (TIGR01784 family)